MVQIIIYYIIIYIPEYNNDEKIIGISNEITENKFNYYLRLYGINNISFPNIRAKAKVTCALFNCEPKSFLGRGRCSNLNPNLNL